MPLVFLIAVGALALLAGTSVAAAMANHARPSRPSLPPREPQPRPSMPPTRPAPVPPEPPPPIHAGWAAVLEPGCRAHAIPLAFALRWGELESAFNPCAVGSPAEHGPDGQPRELGIAQLYNPDDLVRARVTGAQLRAYCVPGDQHEIRYKGRVVRGFSQELSRPLTAAEIQTQADLLVGLISFCMGSASRDLRAVGARPAWEPSTRSYWALVKLQHGLPGLSRSGLPAVHRRLGRAPRDWSEFRASLAQVTLDGNTEKYRSDFGAILDNAERCASVIPETPGIGPEA